MKRFLPILLAILVFAAALILMRPESKAAIVIAAADLPEGHVIGPEEVKTTEVPQSGVPAGAFQNIQEVIGQIVRAPRAAGDTILASHLGGGLLLDLAADERAVAVTVNDAGGLAGILKPGDRISVIAVIGSNGASAVSVAFPANPQGTPIPPTPAPPSGTFSKVTLSNLRVLYVSPNFRAVEPAAQTSSQGGLLSGSSSSSSSSSNRQNSGVIILAAPASSFVPVVYDFGAEGLSPQIRMVNAVELLAALSQDPAARIALALEPENAQPVQSSGVFLTNLVVSPNQVAASTPTPTSMP